MRSGCSCTSQQWPLLPFVALQGICCSTAHRLQGWHWHFLQLRGIPLQACHTAEQLLERSPRFAQGVHVAASLHSSASWTCLC